MKAVFRYADNLTKEVFVMQKTRLCLIRVAGSRMLAIATVASCLLLTRVGQSPAFGAPEKGPRCSDGIDNDGDGCIDGDDSDCGGIETDCSDGQDNDCDGLTDGEDPDCGGGGGGGGGEVGQHIAVCITFDEGLGIATDDLTDPSYCEGDSNGKVTARVGRNFGITLDGNNTNRKTAGRTFFLDVSAGRGCAGSVNVDVDACVGCDDCVDGLEPDLPATRFGDPPLDQKFGFPDNAKLGIGGQDLDGLPVGHTFETRARLRFSVGREDYRLEWGPFKGPGGSLAPTRCPESDPVIVTRVDNDTWTFETTGEHRACMYIDDKFIQCKMVYLGQFVVPFRATAVAIEHEPTIWGDPPLPMILGDPACMP
ncbi:MAG: hypothetical protein GY778_10285 [bacterium]|nr:hypothetical protein [bacterium]